MDEPRNMQNTLQYPATSQHYFRRMTALLTLLMTLLITIKSPLLLASDESNELSTWITSSLESKAKTLSHSIKNSRYEISLDPLPKLPVQPCETQPDIHFLTGMEAGSQRIKVECSEPQRWSLYARGHISLYVPVVVARRAMSRGESLRESDTTIREMDISQLRRGYLLTTDVFHNQQLTRRLQAGDVITPQSLQAATLIRRGDRIQIIASNQGFEISMPGEALENGTLNQQIRVKNLSSGKTVHGIVSGNTTVSVL